MPSASKKFYITIAAISAILLTAPAAGQIEFPEGDNKIWLNGSQTEVNFTSTGSTCSELWLSGNEGVNVSFDSEDLEKGYLTGKDFGSLAYESVEEDILGEATVFLDYEVLNCNQSGGSIEERYIELKHLEFPKVDSSLGYNEEMGMGYFGEIIGWEGRNEFTKPVTIFDIALHPTSEEFDPEKLEFTDTPDNILTGSVTYSQSSKSLSMETTESYVPPESDGNVRNVEIDVKYGSGSGALDTSFKVPVRVYPWRPEIVGGHPGRKIQYENLGDLEYEVNIDSAPGYTSDLGEEDFIVSVEDLEDGETKYNERNWVSTGEGEAEYILSLNNIPDLGTGKYRFIFEIKKDEVGKAPIDAVRVVKTRQFSGQVRDSSGNGVKTRMILKNNERTIPVSAGSDGMYSKEISANGDEYSAINLRFFDRGQSTPDATFNTENVNLGKESTVGGSEAVKFEYWENAPVDVPGINPVNMMAVKFGYDIQGAVKTSMAFNPANINPEDLKVFECTSWNFLGRRCLGDWEQVSGNDVSINYANWRVNIESLDLHQISEDIGDGEKDILMNAYLVGTNAKLGLEGEESPLSVSSGSIVSGGDLEVSGTVISSQGSPVDEADVRVRLLNGSEVVKEFTGESESDGDFTVSGEVPSEPGDYRLGVELSESPYVPFETVSESSIEVFYETGMELESPEEASIVPGEDSEVAFELRNTGQVPIEDLEVSLEGLEQRFYELESSPSSLDEGEDDDIVYSVSIPEGFCPYPCGDPPNFNIQVSGDAGDEEQRATTSMFLDIMRSQPGNDTAGSTAEESSQDVNETSQDSTSLADSVEEEIIAPTGAFLQSQSSLNIALGLIMVFSMILAAAVKRKDGDGRDRRQVYGNQGYGGSTGQPRNGDFGAKVVSGEDLENSPELEQVVEEKEEEDEAEKAEKDDEPKRDQEEQVEEEEDSGEKADGEDEEDGKYVCEETGEEFDTKEALEMHKKINGID